jgi:hypothetical protein
MKSPSHATLTEGSLPGSAVLRRMLHTGWFALWRNVYAATPGHGMRRTRLGAAGISIGGGHDPE